MNNLPAGGNWEGGYRTPDGREWVHVPWQGWQERRRPHVRLRVQRPRRWWHRLLRREPGWTERGVYEVHPWSDLQEKP